MTLNRRSLRVRVSILYIVFTVATMLGLGAFSYWCVDQALASSRQRTMEARENRLIAFISEWPASGSNSTLVERLRQLNLALATTDTVQLYETDGRLVYSSPGSSALKIGWPKEGCIQRCNGLIRRDGHLIRTLNHVVTLEGHTYRLSLSGKIDEHADAINSIRNSYLLVCPLMLLLSIGGGFVLSGRALEPISRITAEAQNIGIQDLKRRIPVPNTGDELQLLAITWNQLLERLEVAVERLTQFTSDISHDLNTGITIMMTTAGLALSRDRTTEEYRIALQSINVECEATAQLLDKLLAIARSDLVHQKIEWKPLNLTDLIAEVTQQLKPRAILKNQIVELHIKENLSVTGDILLLRRMVSILIDNAIKYTPNGGSITISLNRSKGNLHFRVSDNGIGIPENAITRIFDRFYRVDSSRSESGESNGLGLAIAKWVAETHRSTITVISAPGQGSTFTVSIPEALLTEEYDEASASKRRFVEHQQLA